MSVPWVEVESTNILAMRYVSETMHLDIRFRSGGVYRYFNVKPDIAQELAEASSKGLYFQSVVKPYHQVERLEGKDLE